MKSAFEDNAFLLPFVELGVWDGFEFLEELDNLSCLCLHEAVEKSLTDLSHRCIFLELVDNTDNLTSRRIANHLVEDS
jgi:hypothetical protein